MPIWSGTSKGLWEKGGDDMKKIILLGLILLFVGSSAGFSQNIPLPKEIVIKTPSADLPKEIAAFLGKWKGKWAGASAWGERNVSHILVVMEIDSEKAEVIYATAAEQGADSASENITAKIISGGNPKIEFNTVSRPGSGHIGPRTWYTFEMQKDLKTLKGVTGNMKATLQKIE